MSRMFVAGPRSRAPQQSGDPNDNKDKWRQWLLYIKPLPQARYRKAQTDQNPKPLDLNTDTSPYSLHAKQNYRYSK